MKKFELKTCQANIFPQDSIDFEIVRFKKHPNKRGKIPKGRELIRAVFSNMHTKQILQSKWNLYCRHLLVLSWGWAALAPHPSKFHASLWTWLIGNGAFLLPCLPEGFRNSSQSKSLHGKEEINCPVSLPLPHVLFLCKTVWANVQCWYLCLIAIVSLTGIILSKALHTFYVPAFLQRRWHSLQTSASVIMFPLSSLQQQENHFPLYFFLTVSQGFMCFYAHDHGDICISLTAHH